ncbi:HAAS signaling domain-containing protein [Phytoactinopolyspora halotolerans]|uniref:Uncharacterized protein n=1 Tax=Phytoactinopolyspora halotolerans TaxID=1981512 RepID=A0A6L9SIT9_9ACTN|nr:hypothetical protein [Phytoactinopolyspora halotolerans]NEE04588.1 hypothetical protein [Phytoactinopolyspora halotolerans]
MTASRVDKYVDNLIFALRMRNVPGKEIGQIVAEVEAHVAESGEDPAEAFGRPREYARTWARNAGHRQSRPELVRSVLGIVAAGAGGSLLGVGVIGTATGESVWRLHPVLAVLAGIIMMASGAFALPKTDHVIDPRTGQEFERISRSGRRAMLITGAAVVAWLIAATVLAVVLG